jgi:hypothetical protein
MTDNLPANWSNDEMLDGLDVLDKGELVNVPMRLTGVTFRANDSGVEFAEIDGERADGSTFTFQDTSNTGVKAQIKAYLTEKKIEIDPDSGEYHAFSIVIPRGLRLSEFEKTVTVAGKTNTVKARVYYLTTSGKRAAAGQPEAKQSRTRKPATS